MKRILMVLALGICLIGCKGKAGSNGSGGGSMQKFEGTNPETTWGVQIDNFNVNDTVSVYYALAADTQTFFEMRGPDTPSTSTPYYEFLISGTGVLVRMHNIPVNSTYRIMIWRPSTIL